MIYKLYKIERFFYKIKLTFIAIIIRAIIRVIFSCDIPYKAEIGEGTSFPHLGLGVLIHPDCIIGKNCKILQGVTVGGKSGHKQVPIIGDNVLLGANSIIIGPIKIGNNATVGAGSVVVKDVPENATVVGNPAKEIKSKTNKEENREENKVV